MNAMTLSNVAQRPGLPDTRGHETHRPGQLKTTHELLRKAADKRWADAVMTNSDIVLALAKIAAGDSLRKGRGSR